jgi:hypothetical protein
MTLTAPEKPTQAILKFFSLSAQIDDLKLNLHKLPTVLVVTTILGLGWMDAYAWETRLDEDGILVQSRLTSGAKYEEFRAEAEIEATVAQAIALLKDISACTKWLFRCKESRLIRETSTTERIFYQVTSLPFPAKSRDSIFHAAITFESGGTVRVTMSSMPNEIPQTKHVRVREAIGTYILEPIRENKLRVTWQQYVDPGGALPAWLVNSMLTDLPFKSMRAFRELVQQSPYRDARLVYGPDGTPTDINFNGSQD